MGIHKHVPRESRSNPWVSFHRTLYFEKEPFAANWHSLSLGLTDSLSAPDLFCLLLPSTEVSSPQATPINVGGCWIHKEVHVLALSLVLGLSSSHLLKSNPDVLKCLLLNSLHTKTGIREIFESS